MATLITGGTGLHRHFARRSAPPRGRARGALRRGVAGGAGRSAASLWRAAPARAGRRAGARRAGLGDPRRGDRRVVHLAFVLGAVGEAEPERATRVNVLGTVNALEAARLTGVPRVLLASSIAVYGSDDQYTPAELPLREDAARHVCRTTLIYGGGKLYTEHLAHVYARTYGTRHRRAQAERGLRARARQRRQRLPERGDQRSPPSGSRSPSGSATRASASSTSRTSPRSSARCSGVTRLSSRASASSIPEATPRPCASWRRPSSASSPARGSP